MSARKTVDAGAAVSTTHSSLEYARTHGLHALVVTQNGRILSETYGEDYDGLTSHPLYSGTKSFWGITAVRAERDEILRLDVGFP